MAELEFDPASAVVVELSPDEFDPSSAVAVSPEYPDQVSRASSRPGAAKSTAPLPSHAAPLDYASMSPDQISAPTAAPGKPDYSDQVSRSHAAKNEGATYWEEKVEKFDD